MAARRVYPKSVESKPIVPASSKGKKGFQKGHKHSAKKGLGRGKIGRDREDLINRKIDNTTITKYLTLNSHLTPQELIDRLQNEKVSTLEAMIIKIMLKGCRTGDIQQTSFVLDRLIGKVPNEMVHRVPNPYENYTDEELMAEKRRVCEINRKSMDYLEQHHPKMIENERIAKEIEAATPESD